LTEQLGEAKFFVGAVMTPLGLDHDLAAQRQGVDGSTVGRCDPQPKIERRHGGIRLDAGADDLERHRAHRATATFSPIRSKNASSAAWASVPPSNPFHNTRSRPTSS